MKQLRLTQRTMPLTIHIHVRNHDLHHKTAEVCWASLCCIPSKSTSHLAVGNQGQSTGCKRSLSSLHTAASVLCPPQIPCAAVAAVKYRSRPAGCMQEYFAALSCQTFCQETEVLPTRSGNMARGLSGLCHSLQNCANDIM